MAALEEGAHLKTIEVSCTAGRVNIELDLYDTSIRSRLIVLKAGTAAQIIRILMRDWNGKPPVPENWLPEEVLTVNAASDARTFKSIIGGGGRDPADNALMVGCLGAAVRYVATPERWGRIEALANALRMRSGMWGDEAEEIVANALPADPERVLVSKLVAIRFVGGML